MPIVRRASVSVCFFFVILLLLFEDLNTSYISHSPFFRIPFRYTLPEAASLRLRVTNTYGREMITLVNHPQMAGEHTVDWAGQMYGGALSQAGTYFYELAITLPNGVTVRRTGQMMLYR